MAARRGHKLTRFRFLRALRAIRSECPSQHWELIDFTVTEARSDLDAGEGYMALELLINNLYEVSFPLSATLHGELRWLVARLSLKAAYAELLDQMRA